MAISRDPKNIRIRRFMPRPCAPCPSAIPIHVGQRMAVSENTVIMRELVLPHLLRRAYCAVVGVVEEQIVSAATLDAVQSDTPNELGIIPFMNENEVNAA